MEYGVSWVRVPPEAAHFFYCLGCAVLLCLVCLFDLACLLSFFLLISHLGYAKRVLASCAMGRVFICIHLDVH